MRTSALITATRPRTGTPLLARDVRGSTGSAVWTFVCVFPRLAQAMVAREHKSINCAEMRLLTRRATGRTEPVIKTTARVSSTGTTLKSADPKSQSSLNDFGLRRMYGTASSGARRPLRLAIRENSAMDTSTAVQQPTGPICPGNDSALMFCRLLARSTSSKLHRLIGLRHAPLMP